MSVDKLLFAYVIAGIHRDAHELWLRHDETGPVVELHHVDGRIDVEQRLDLNVFAHLLRRLGEMANLPYRRRDEVALGTLGLRFGDKPTRYFAVEVAGWATTEVARVTLRDYGN